MLKEIVFANDKYNMNWLRDDFVYGEVNCPKDLDVQTSHEWENGVLTSKFVFKNITDHPFFTSLHTIGIRFPMQDKYEDSTTCITSRCHTHLYCGLDVSYVYALRMGGEAPHLGMIVTEGSLGGYSVERDLEHRSNDRGCFILHPSPEELEPGEEMTVTWKIFAHNGEEDFYQKAGKFTRFVKVTADKYVLFPGENCSISMETSFDADTVTVDGTAAEKIGQNQFIYSFAYTSDLVKGDREFAICADGVQTKCRILLHEAPDQLAQTRCRFIAEKQQYRRKDGKAIGLDGAYLVYDNEEKHIYYNHENDYNGGRERVGMAVLLTAYLKQLKAQGKWDSVIEESLKRYHEFVFRELIDTQTGEVFNEYGRDNSYIRIYNEPWFATLCTEWYGLYGKKEYLTYACRIVRSFYSKGGFVFYPIELPILALCRELKNAELEAEYQEMVELFCKHGDSMLEIGVNYPPSEVNYEQSIVAPAANVLMQLYFLTGKEKYLEGGKMQIAVLELFNGHQPDYHLYETAIRHWDGYWFGKPRTYGDTFPHYWSGLTGSCFALYYAATGDKTYAKRAKDSLRGVLSMIFPDGTASCACLFPVTVNGAKPDGWDAYANDQDWAMYFYLRMERELAEVLA